VRDPHLSRVHLLRVEEGPERFAALVAALAGAGMRAGWLELAADLPGDSAAGPDRALPVPAGLAAAAAAGVLRAVAVGGGRSVAVKPLKGAPVLADLLREHFRGCAVVLVRGAAAAPHLVFEGDGWKVAPPGEADRALTTAELVAALRRPRPWA
jgi:hypothetical protein